MPIYEYRCSACGSQQEYLQKMNDAPLTDCPECGKRSLSKMVTAAGFQLKGSGWYATDFKHGPKAKPGADAKSAAKSEDKPAPPSAAKPASETPAKKSETPATAGSGAGSN